MIVFNDEVVAEPVSKNAARAINDFHAAHMDELAKILEPHGIDPEDILEPTYERIVHEDEIPIFARLAHERRRPPRKRAQ